MYRQSTTDDWTKVEQCCMEKSTGYCMSMSEDNYGKSRNSLCCVCISAMTQWRLPDRILDIDTQCPSSSLFPPPSTTRLRVSDALCNYVLVSFRHFHHVHDSRQCKTHGDSSVEKPAVRVRLYPGSGNTFMDVFWKFSAEIRSLNPHTHVELTHLQILTNVLEENSSCSLIQIFKIQQMKLIRLLWSFVQTFITDKRLYIILA